MKQLRALSKRGLEAAVLVLAFFPLGFVLSLLAFFFHAFFILGYPPMYDRPDPKTISVYSTYAPIIIWLLIAWVLTFIPSLLATAVYWILNRKSRQRLKPVLITVAIQVWAIWMLILSDVMEWFAD